MTDAPLIAAICGVILGLGLAGLAWWLHYLFTPKSPHEVAVEVLLAVLARMNQARKEGVVPGTSGQFDGIKGKWDGMRSGLEVNVPIEPAAMLIVLKLLDRHPGITWFSHDSQSRIWFSYNPNQDR